MLMGRPVHGSAAGIDKKRVHLSVAVLPMGRVSAVSVYQHIHCRVALSQATLPLQLKWRWDGRIPLDDRKQHHAWGHI